MSQLTQAAYVVGEMRRPADARDFAPAAGVLTEVKRLVETNVNFARGAKRSDVP